MHVLVWCILTQDDRRLFDYNVEERVNDFIKYILQVVDSYRTGHIMFTFGGDFQYRNAIEDYKNLDKLMKYTMEKVSLICTLSCVLCCMYA